MELINGEIIKRSPIYSPHASVVDYLAEQLYEKLLKKAKIRIQNPIRIGSHSEPEPDIVVTKKRLDHYRLRHPRPSDVYLVIEVSDSTLSKERGIKKALYAVANIPEYWIVNVPEKQIEIYRKPKNQDFEESEVVDLKGKAICKTIEFEIEVKEIFG